MAAIFDFCDKLDSCQSAKEVDVLWQSWCTRLGFIRSGTQITRLRDNQMFMARICTNYPDDEVDYYVQRRFFRFAQSLNPLRKPARLEGIHVDTFSTLTDGKPARFRDFVEFVRDIKVPAEMWVRFPTSNTESISFCIWSDENERQFQLRLGELRSTIVSAASMASAKLQHFGIEPMQLLSAPLTGREVDCLLFLACGDRQREIANRMSIDIKTVEMHLSNARKKLDARTTHQAIARAILQGHINP